MKKTITILIIVLLLFPTLLAQPKRVTIPEPLGGFSLIQKTILQSELADALNSSGNYETFDGDAELACVSELTNKEGQLLVECKLVELESGKVLTSVTHHIAKEPITEFEKGCKLLATKLMWWNTAGEIVNSGKEVAHNVPTTYNLDGIELVFVEGNDTMKGFYIGKFEITQAQWKAIMWDNPSDFVGDSFPVENVSWHDVQSFLLKLNLITGKNYRLPTEAEWEFAANGGTESKGFLYSGSNNLNVVAWHKENSNKSTHPVGKKIPNELGIHDMSGNVREWCEDWYDSSQQFRAVRGGSWNDVVQNNCVTFRYRSTPRNSINVLGFRVALSL